MSYVAIDVSGAGHLVKLRHLSSRHSAVLFYIVNAICLAWAVVSIELTLAWNNIAEVYTIRTTGQLIPFTIGLTSFVTLIHKISVRQSSIRQTDFLMVRANSRRRGV